MDFFLHSANSRFCLSQSQSLSERGNFISTECLSAHIGTLRLCRHKPFPSVLPSSTIYGNALDIHEFYFACAVFSLNLFDCHRDSHSRCERCSRCSYFALPADSFACLPLVPSSQQTHPGHVAAVYWPQKEAKKKSRAMKQTERNGDAASTKHITVNAPNTSFREATEK